MDRSLQSLQSSTSGKVHIEGRVGSVSYLNARPLTYAIGSPVMRLEPSHLSKQLEIGGLEVGLVPVMEALEHAERYVVVDGVAIGALRDVYSVYMTHKKPLASVRTVALDRASRTSIHLVQVLLEIFHNMRPEYGNGPLGIADERGYVEPEADAEVIIGDRAIVYRQNHPDALYMDLSAEWNRWTGLPFVFAVWAIRREALARSPSLPDQLRAAAEAGLAARREIANGNAFQLKYLTEHIHYGLGSDQKEAIRYFAENLVKLGKLGKIPSLEYV